MTMVDLMIMVIWQWWNDDDADVEIEDDDDNDDNDEDGCDSIEDEGNFVDGITANGDVSNVKHDWWNTMMFFET